MPRRPDVYIRCTVPGCDNSMVARGWCRMHYARWKRVGNTDPPLVPTVEERFWSFVDKYGPVHPVIKTRCWLWTGGRHRGGHGAFNSGPGQKAHRYSWLLHFGDPSGLCVLHKCDNPPCVRSDHLFLGTYTDNNADRDAKGRMCRGEAHHLARLNEEMVLEIRSMYVRGSSTHGSTALAKKYGVSHATILCAVKNKCWKHV